MPTKHFKVFANKDVRQKKRIVSADYIKSEDEGTNEFDLPQVEQKFSSKKTAVNGKQGKLPAIFKLVNFSKGTINLDYGGGTEDAQAVADAYFEDKDVKNLIYDVYNQTAEHNRDVVKQIRSNGGADTATLSNVLNVIAEPESRMNVLQNIKKLLKSNGTLYVTVYEGAKANRGQGKQTGEDQFQTNMALADYLEEIQQVYPNATRKGKLIIAPNGGAVTSATRVNGADDGYQFPSLDGRDLTDKDYRNYVNQLAQNLNSGEVEMEDAFEFCEELGNKFGKSASQVKNDINRAMNNVSSSTAVKRFKVTASDESRKRTCRISSYKEFDNGRVMFNWSKMTVQEAENAAKQASIKDPDNIYYVKFDDIMNPDTDNRWIAGECYHWSEVQMEGDRPVVKAREDGVESASDPYSNENYRGYRLVLNHRFGFWEIYDKHRELEDSGFRSKKDAKEWIDEELKIWQDPEQVYNATDITAATHSDAEQYWLDEFDPLIADLANKCGLQYDDDQANPTDSRIYHRFLTYIAPKGKKQFVQKFNKFEAAVQSALANTKWPEYIKVNYSYLDVNQAGSLPVEISIQAEAPEDDSYWTPPGEEKSEYEDSTIEGARYVAECGLKKNVASVDDSVSGPSEKFPWPHFFINQFDVGMLVAYEEDDAIKIEDAETCELLAICKSDMEYDDYLQRINSSASQRQDEKDGRYSANAATEIDGARLPERPLDPPEYDEPTEVDDSQEDVSFDFDCDILLGEDSWDYADQSYDFAKGPGTRGNWYAEESGALLGDKTSMVEYLDEILADMLPEKPGVYHISGKAHLKFDVSGVYKYSDFQGVDEDNDPIIDETYDTESADARFNREASSIENFNCEFLSDIV